jgi:hypothetical protein
MWLATAALIRIVWRLTLRNLDNWLVVAEVVVELPSSSHAPQSPKMFGVYEVHTYIISDCGATQNEVPRNRQLSLCASFLATSRNKMTWVVRLKVKLLELLAMIQDK